MTFLGNVDMSKSLQEDVPPPRLLDRGVRAAIRGRHYSIRTEDAYVDCFRRYPVAWQASSRGLGDGGVSC